MNEHGDAGHGDAGHGGVGHGGVGHGGVSSGLTRESFSAGRTRAMAAAAPAGVFISVSSGPDQAPDSRRVSVGGPVDGIGFAVKDNIETSELPTTAGTEALRGSWPRRDAGVVAALRSAGGVVVGKTNLHELAFGITGDNGSFGPTRNPHDPRRSAGGSSSGSAAAVAAGIVPFALGTDTGGSIRIPAAHCGVVGLRPTTGRYPATGVAPLSWTRDTVGILARNVADAARIDAVVTADERFEPREPSGVTLGWSRDGFGADLADDVATVMRDVYARLERSGMTLVEVATQRLVDVDARCGFPITFFESAHTVPGYLYTLDAPYSDLGVEGLAAASRSADVRAILQRLARSRVTRGEYDAAMAGRSELQRAYAGLFSQTGIDALIYPTVAIVAPLLSETTVTTPSGRTWPLFDLTIRNTSPGSVAGVPSISLPAGDTASGLPVGVSLEAPVESDRGLLAVAVSVERALQGARGR